MPAKVVLTEEEKEYYITLFFSDYGMKAIQQITKRDVHRTIRPVWVKHFGEQGLKERCSRLNRIHKIGSLNPMWGKSGSQHHNSKEKSKKTFTRVRNIKDCSMLFQIQKELHWFQRCRK